MSTYIANPSKTVNRKFVEHRKPKMDYPNPEPGEATKVYVVGINPNHEYANDIINHISIGCNNDRVITIPKYVKPVAASDANSYGKNYPTGFASMELTDREVDFIKKAAKEKIINPRAKDHFDWSKNEWVKGRSFPASECIFITPAENFNPFEIEVPELGLPEKLDPQDEKQISDKQIYEQQAKKPKKGK